MIALPPQPRIRQDLQWVGLDDAAGYPNARILLSDPRTQSVLRLTGKEACLCRFLDGTHSLEEAGHHCAAALGMEVSAENLEAFVRSLADAGLLELDTGPALRHPVEKLRRLPVHADAHFRRLAWLFGWAYGGVGWLLWSVSLLLAICLVVDQWSMIWSYVTDLDHVLRRIASPGLASWSHYFQLLAVMIALPILREWAKGTTCRRFGARVNAIHLGFILYLIPRLVLDLSPALRLPRRQRMRILASGIFLQAFLFACGMIALEVWRPDHPFRFVALVLSLVCGLRLLLDMNPFGQQDGGTLLALWLEIPDFHQRAIRVFRARLLFRPIPESLSRQEAKRFFRYGFWFSLYQAILQVGGLLLISYVLTTKFGVLGALFIGALLGQHYASEIHRGAWWFAAYVKRYLFRRGDVAVRLAPREVAWAAGWVLVLVLIGLIPVRSHPSGPFRVEPVASATLRSDLDSVIETMPFEEGASVRAGDVVATLSTRRLDARLAMARAALRRSRAVLAVLEAGPSQAEVALVQQAEHTLRVSAEYSDRALARMRRLYDADAASREAVERRQRRRDVEFEAAELAVRTLNWTEAGVTDEVLLAQGEAISGLESEIAYLEAQQERATLVAPIDGRLTTLFAASRTGRRVRPGDLVVRIDQMDTTRVRIAVPESRLHDVSIGAAVALRAGAFPGVTFAGTVQRILPVALSEAEDRTRRATSRQEEALTLDAGQFHQIRVPVMVEVSNGAGPLPPHATGRARIEGPRRPLGLLLLEPGLRYFNVNVWSWLP